MTPYFKHRFLEPFILCNGYRNDSFTAGTVRYIINWVLDAQYLSVFTDETLIIISRYRNAKEQQRWEKKLNYCLLKQSQEIIIRVLVLVNHPMNDLTIKHCSGNYNANLNFIYESSLYQ